MRYDLVIFDNDGVLVDSEPLANRVLAGYLTELGHPTSYTDALRDYMGGSVRRVHDIIRERTGRHLPADFDSILHSRTFDAFRAELQPVNGVSELLRGLAADALPYCLASSSSHERIRVALQHTGLLEYFDEQRIFSSEDVRRGKPAPDLFQHAAGSMGVPPERCVVIEDSPLGVQAAIAAGMEVYGYVAMTPPDRLAQASGVFSDMSALPELLAG
ncbi:HAD family hydrolase [Streptomyces oceani]|uniref:Hydrolase n=1 Tax=Streptomyces oceani TaxID=1075402 RepID=A0A1E7KHH7_9ACTN|nr:HAD family hydrolase [Streptomyces oceani]OEV03400.1 hydrolase [Streptomyces oceani]